MKQLDKTQLEEQRAYLTKLKSIYETKLLNINKQIEEIDNETE